MDFTGAQSKKKMTQYHYFTNFFGEVFVVRVSLLLALLLCVFVVSGAEAGDRLRK